MPHSSSGALIIEIRPGSLAAEAGMAPGDRLMSINDQEMQDLIDYYRLTVDDHLRLRLKKADGKEQVLTLEREEGDDLGLVFDQMVCDGIRQCHNHCLFCFVDQMPPGMRSSLYIKDDDYRLSFLSGTFVTLTNLSPADVERIKKLKLGPLYVSVHATSPQVRKDLVKNPRSGEILDLLKDLATAGITFHTQVVLCPGINDGPILEQTLSDLLSLWPAVLSIAVVPVGITRYRTPSPHLRPFTPAEARAVLTQVGRWQEKALAENASRVVFAADEFYLTAGLPFPADEAYEDYPQLENGVGMARLFITQFEEALSGIQDPPLSHEDSEKTCLLVTGRSGEKVLTPLLAKVDGIKVMGVDNVFFGETVTVTGLITGQDIVKQVKDYLVTPPAGKRPVLLLPGVIFRDSQGETLDGYSASRLAQETGLTVEVLPVSGEALAQALFGR